MEKKLLFALDIGTRSVVGLVGEQSNGVINLLGWERREHHTRAMLDGQIHDVTEVAKVLGAVKSQLEAVHGPLTKVSVAAAGRALCTIRAAADIETYNRGVLVVQDEHALELAAIQSAQQKLATSGAVADPTSYYCVGYSVVGYSLDGSAIKSLVGQRGKTAAIELIATFLPRQVIDSLQSAIQLVNLDMATLTLEPIAAISVLIPETMRHLNLALVDVGAGTSDVAITRDGSVIGYGMVPCAGDEITEALSQKYLLDFNVAEVLKRQLNGKAKKVSFTDVLGATHKLSTKEVIDSITSQVTELAQAIAKQILELNTTPPQAVLLVGGGSLTPLLEEALAQSLDIVSARVAIRRPEKLEGLTNIPPELATPDAVTPLGILKLAGSRTLNFVHVTLNGQKLRLFNLGRLTVADALLAAGINVRSLQGRPGLGLTITLNGETKFIPGSLGQPGSIAINDKPGLLNTAVQEEDIIMITKGVDGAIPCPRLQDMVTIPAPFVVHINKEPYELSCTLTVNGKMAAPETILADRDTVICRMPATLEEVLCVTGLRTDPEQIAYSVNGIAHHLDTYPTYSINHAPAHSLSIVRPLDHIQIIPFLPPSIGEVLDLGSGATESLTVLFNGKKCVLPIKSNFLTVNGSPATAGDTLFNGCTIECSWEERPHPIVSDVLLAGNFDSRTLHANSRISILRNGHRSEYTALVYDGDKIDVLTE